MTREQLREIIEDRDIDRLMEFVQGRLDRGITHEELWREVGDRLLDMDVALWSSWMHECGYHCRHWEFFLREQPLEEIEAHVVFAQWHMDNVLYEERGKRRVLHSRMTVADGMPYDNQVTVEEFDGETWVKLLQYEAR